eukprot:6183120-Pleurochrysis_carterae.AAC.1
MPHMQMHQQMGLPPQMPGHSMAPFGEGVPPSMPDATPAMSAYKIPVGMLATLLRRSLNTAPRSGSPFRPLTSNEIPKTIPPHEPPTVRCSQNIRARALQAFSLACVAKLVALYDTGERLPIVWSVISYFDAAPGHVCGLDVVVRIVPGVCISQQYSMHAFCTPELIPGLMH